MKDSPVDGQAGHQLSPAAQAALDQAAAQQPTSSGYVRAVGPKLRKLLLVVFLLAALLAANGGYLAAITALNWWTGESYEDQFYAYMFLLHLALGLIFLAPFLVFGIVHMFAARGRRNRRAVAIGYFLFAVCVILLLTGVLLTRVGNLELKNPTFRSVAYWLHVLLPLAALWLYGLHRLAGPTIKWRVGLVYLGVVAAIVVLMVGLRYQDPRQWNRPGPKSGEKYFKPSLVTTASGKFIDGDVLDNDEYCLKCHQDAYDGWFHSAHHFSSFNNPAYLYSVRETRAKLYERDGNVQASRWCAGCHDPVPFLTGAFDKPDYDDVNDPTAHAGITCTVCHAMTNINSTKGNAAYTIEEPLHYPFAFSENRFLQMINETMIKAKPSFHKRTFLKPFHKSADFCSVCHKVSLPKELTHYKDFLRGQNHYDAFLLSGVSGHGAKSFYYPKKAHENCNRCHMPLKKSNDFAALRRGDDKFTTIHDHLFPAANTAVPWMNEHTDIIKIHQDFLKDVARVDLFGIIEGKEINGKLHAPLRPSVPELKPGGTYLIETVVRTLTLGHLFTQGTVDSNEVWVELAVVSDGETIGHSGLMDEDAEVDRWAHFLNVFMLDKDGNRIARRNAQDIVVPLYNHQIPPGAAATLHYSLTVPEGTTKPIEIEVALKYRKFDKEYTDFMAASFKDGDHPFRGYEKGKPYRNQFPITVIASDRIVLPVAGGASVENSEREIPVWQRWNDYGIGLLLKKESGQTLQAINAFQEVEKLDRYDGPLNLARAYFREGSFDLATEAMQRAALKDSP
ncbi:MAG: multiheme c-type cytochrome, partial [Pirellulaceae bacterium]